MAATPVSEQEEKHPFSDHAQVVSQQLNSCIRKANLVWLRFVKEKGSHLAGLSMLGRTGIWGRQIGVMKLDSQFWLQIRET